ncbi:Protein CBG01348 [Caenorhabditis briggsae]|uniref:Protein CBG01348 n=1 Tax=Caenorhabditis briggsae TaxID=6238 RepID=A8WQ73_CAEBR|nr:Protein CBG01348 [Caenorhabditis briggsae]CAP22631.2 Protein CBG01348 [Caenorhabditis briggsae]
MYINWVHHYVPKISFVLSLIANPLFIYLVITCKKTLFGSYRYLLSFFATFNLLASFSDLATPVCVFNYRYVFVTFVADGPFSWKSKYGEQLLYYRCGIVSGTYGILNVHFVFRYLTLKRNAFVNKHFMPYGLILAIMYVAAHIAIWAAVTGLCLHSAQEMRDYIREPFKALHNESFDDITFVAGLFSETTAEIAERSWTGIVLLTVIASYSIVLYIVLGYKIVTGINTKSSTMSKQTAQMQKQLFKALTIQTIIPICVSFMPCSLSFYGAALRIDFVNWVYWGAAVAVSFFPFLDPVAVTLFLPTLRKRLISFGHVDNSVHQHYSDTSVGH